MVLYPKPLATNVIKRLAPVQKNTPHTAHNLPDLKPRIQKIGGFPPILRVFSIGVLCGKHHEFNRRTWKSHFLVRPWPKIRLTLLIDAKLGCSSFEICRSKFPIKTVFLCSVGSNCFVYVYCHSEPYFFTVPKGKAVSSDPHAHPQTDHQWALLRSSKYPHICDHCPQSS